MTPFPSIASPRRLDRGGVSWVTALLLAVIASAIYLAIVWVPIYFVHYEVKQAVRDYMNQAIKNRDDASLVENMCAKLRVLDTVTVVGEDGRERKVPAIDLQPQDVTWERDTSGERPMLHVAFEYKREVRYPYLSETPREWVGSVDLQNDIGFVDWGPSR
jgi:hypothetical protein